MVNRLPLVALVAAFALALPSVISAQQMWRLAQAPKTKGPGKKAAPPPAEEDVPEVEELTPGQIRRAQEPVPPAAVIVPKGPAAPAAAKAPKQVVPTQPRAIACGGVFAKDTSHVKLAMTFQSDNLTFAEVDGPSGSKLMATVLFPKEPRRRVEILWKDEAARSDISVIAITRQSGWTAPKGLALRMPLAAVERINGKPFKLKGLDSDKTAIVADWQGGGLAALPGGCQLGVRLAADPKTAAPILAALAPAGSDFLSTDPKILAARLTVMEILVGY